MIFINAIVPLGSFLLGCVVNHLIEEKKSKIVNATAYQARLFQIYHNINLEKGYLIERYFYNRQYHKILVYGLGRYYLQFLEGFKDKSKFDFLLADSSGVAKNQDSISQKVYNKEEISQLEIDCIVITSLAYGKEIEKELKQIGIETPIVTYKELVLNLEKENY